MYAPIKLLPWTLLLNAVLMAFIAERFTALQHSWAVHSMAAESYLLLLEEPLR